MEPVVGGRGGTIGTVVAKAVTDDRPNGTRRTRGTVVGDRPRDPLGTKPGSRRGIAAVVGGRPGGAVCAAQ
jgi:hypothetical protein